MTSKLEQRHRRGPEPHPLTSHVPNLRSEYLPNATRHSLTHPNRQVSFPMNSVLRRSLRSVVLQQQLRTPRTSYHVPPLHTCSRVQPRQYSTHHPDDLKDKSAVGVRHPCTIAPLPPPLNALF